ncbi:hypothetical protein BO70DRAFT_377171 [Aspergillus heteromorphus CBS 117.55]|uniref:Mid2 domain-containing protein n=1 Tax=Aspergillus heteromorphus CBS 117.55 TaxID=1448321 RepID=A0A317WU61_9EURO|nr:uncharacterized protein BO70DRAFT_377171 [Aspergillus heteromorphus CBS 117.55]PWY89954.1 hypothetical protein BO70DRAFT_377171 [Aspergillus heteromorphus CBS 117.55]
MPFGMGEDGYGPGDGTGQQTTEEYWDSRTTLAAWYDSLTTEYADETTTAMPTATDMQTTTKHTRPDHGTMMTITTQQWTTIPSIDATTGSISQTTTTTTTTSEATTQATTMSSSTSSASSNSAGDGGSSSGSNTTAIAIAVPVAVVGVAIIAGLLFFLMRRRRQRSRIPPPDPQDNMRTVPRQAGPQNGSTWEFGPASSHDVPFSGPIPGRPVTHHSQSSVDSTRHIDASSSSQNLTTAAQSAPDEEPAMQDYSERHEARISMPVISQSIPVWQEPRHDRPTSPFDHPLDDSISEISHMSDPRQSAAHHRDLDDISSVSSFEDDERRPAISP